MKQITALTGLEVLLKVPRPALGGRGIGECVNEIWNERGMFPIVKDRLCQIRVIKRRTWFTLVELDKIKQGAEKMGTGKTG